MQYNNSRFTILLPTIIACSLVAGMFLGRLVFRNDAPSRRAAVSTIDGSKKLNSVLALIQSEYVDRIDMDSLVEQAIPKILEELDPHSMYLAVQDMPKANELIEGQFDGVGLMFNMATDTVVVLNVITGGPSAKAGIMPGDRILTVNDTVVAGVKMDQDSVVKRLRGPRGTKVKIGIARSGVNDPVTITVTRAPIPVKSIVAAFMIRPTIGYIRLDQFSGTSHKELKQAITNLKNQGMRKLIFDVRYNSGGLLDQAIGIVNEFLPKNRMIVYTKDRTGAQETQYSDGTGAFTDEQLIVLINENSASASEILAGAIQDNDRGLIVGRRSFGKGLVQNQFPLYDGTALRLTIARYYTPSGRSIQKPYTHGSEEYYMDLFNRAKHNEYFSADSIHFSDSLKFKTVSGRTVYGGGGIMPDIFVPVDTTERSNYFGKVYDKNILYRFVLAFSDRHRNELNKVQTFGDIDRFFAHHPEMMDEFVRFAAKQGVAPVASEIAKSRRLMETWIKAYIGRNTKLEDNGFYYCNEPIDTELGKAVRVLETSNHQQMLAMPTTADRVARAATKASKHKTK